MKTYLLDSINRLKRFSQNLDVQATLCGRSWLVFKDSGDKEVYIFEPDNSLVISIKGVVTNATWRYLAVNQSLIISSKDSSFMLHPKFADDVLFVLELDGTNECSFLIDEKNKESFLPSTYTEVTNYLYLKEQILLELEKQNEIETNEAINNQDINVDNETEKNTDKDINTVIAICLFALILILVLIVGNMLI